MFRLLKLASLVARSTKKARENKIWIVGGYEGGEFTQGAYVSDVLIPEDVTQLRFGEYEFDLHFERRGNVFIPALRSRKIFLQLESDFLASLAGYGVANPEAAISSDYRVFGNSETDAKNLVDVLDRKLTAI